MSAHTDTHTARHVYANTRSFHEEQPHYTVVGVDVRVVYCNGGGHTNSWGEGNGMTYGKWVWPVPHYHGLK